MRVTLGLHPPPPSKSLTVVNSDLKQFSSLPPVSSPFSAVATAEVMSLAIILWLQ